MKLFRTLVLVFGRVDSSPPQRIVREAMQRDSPIVIGAARLGYPLLDSMLDTYPSTRIMNAEDLLAVGGQTYSYLARLLAGEKDTLQPPLDSTLGFRTGGIS
jgi:hypothetical protein